MVIILCVNTVTQENLKKDREQMSFYKNMSLLKDKFA